MKTMTLTVNGHLIVLRKFANDLWDAIDFETGVLIYEGDDATLEKVLDEVINYTINEEYTAEEV